MEAVIVNYNGREYLRACMAAIEGQDIPVRPIVVDNCSSDGSVYHLRSVRPDVQIAASAVNLGYAGGANRGIGLGQAPFVAILNPDVLLDPAYLSVLVRRMEADPSIGIAQGKLYRLASDAFREGVRDSDVLDSAGHASWKGRFVVDRGQGEVDEGQYDREESVFSACGAAMVLRRSMLDEIALDGDYFDSGFFAYKEDIDLSWRARNAGWDVRYVPEAVAYHVRKWGGAAPPIETVPAPVRAKSWANHYLMILKNERLGSFLWRLPWILGWEVVRLGYALLRDRSLFRAYGDVFRRLPRAWRHRRRILA